MSAPSPTCNSWSVLGEIAEPTREELDAERMRLEALIVPGVEAFAIMKSDATPSGRRQLLGAARVAVLDVEGERATVRILQGSGVPDGHTYRVAVTDLYASLSKERRRAFSREVERFWGKR